MPMTRIKPPVEPDEPALPVPPLLTGTEALFLDFDGTLTPFAALPDAVVIDPELPPLLAAVGEKLGGALALMTGRPLSQVDRLLGIRLAGSGVHGLQVRTEQDGPLRFLGPEWPMQPAEMALREIVAYDDRLFLETKPGSLALHYRAAPDRAAELLFLLTAFVHGQPDLMLLRGHSVLEIKPAGFDKGRAMGMLLEVAPWKGRVPVVAGDDLTDEDAFAFAGTACGWGVKVGDGQTKARFRVHSIHELMAWLKTSLELSAL